MVQSGVILCQHSGYLDGLPYAFLSKHELPVIHYCFLGQKADCRLPGAFKFNTKVVVREWATNNKLIEMLDEVLNAHHKDAIVLVPLVSIPTTL